MLLLMFWAVLFRLILFLVGGEILAAAGPTNVFDVPSVPVRLISPWLRGQSPQMVDPPDYYFGVMGMGSNSLFRGVAGGIDAETYNWKTLNSFTFAEQYPRGYRIVSPFNPKRTTLDFLEGCRAYGSTPIITINTRGDGSMTSRNGVNQWRARSSDHSTLDRLAADWVRYVNFLLPNYHLGKEGTYVPASREVPPLSIADRRLLDSLHWVVGTNAVPARRLLRLGDKTILPRVKYWEIGNEVEIPMDKTRFDPAIDIGAEEYVRRYKALTESMLRVDPKILVGPQFGNAWPASSPNFNRHLEVLLRDPQARIDFMTYHPYPDNGVMAKAWPPQGKPNIFELEKALRIIKHWHHLQKSLFQTALREAKRDPNLPFLATEWNSSDPSFNHDLKRSLCEAMAAVEMIFCFVEEGTLGANFWGHNQFPPLRDVFTKLTTHLGTEFLGSTFGNFRFAGPGGTDPSSTSNLRIYATRTRETRTLNVWLLNFSNREGQNLELRLPRGTVAGAKLSVLRDPLGRKTELVTPGSTLGWVESSVTVKPTTYMTLGPASLSILELRY